MGSGSIVMAGIGLGDPVIRLGVTGLSRAGKTVFITSLVANLLDRGRMPALRAAAQARAEEPNPVVADAARWAAERLAPA